MTEANESSTKALEFFKDWSNYLLVTTVAAVGWVTAKDGSPLTGSFKLWCVLALGTSVIFGIFTLAVIPIIQEKIKPNESCSIYRLPADFWLWPTLKWLLPSERRSGVYLTWVCFPQHILFIAGVVIYIIGIWHSSP